MSCKGIGKYIYPISLINSPNFLIILRLNMTWSIDIHILICWKMVSFSLSLSLSLSLFFYAQNKIHISWKMVSFSLSLSLSLSLYAQN